MTRQQKLILFLEGAVLYILAGGLTIWGGMRISPLINILPQVSTHTPGLLDITISASTILFVIFLTLEIKWVRYPLRFIFFLTIFFGLSLFLNIFLPLVFSIFLAAYLIMLYFILARPIFHNLVMLCSLVGVALAVGLAASPVIIFILLLVFSLYDIVAVFITKHMIKMARGFFKIGLLPGFLLSFNPRSQLKIGRGASLGEKFSFLGSGDVVLPLLFVASLVNVKLIYAVGAGVGNILGFAVLVFILWGRRREPLPALPPIVFGEVVGFLATYLITR